MIDGDEHGPIQDFPIGSVWIREYKSDEWTVFFVEAVGPKTFKAEWKPGLITGGRVVARVLDVGNRGCSVGQTFNFEPEWPFGRACVRVS